MTGYIPRWFTHTQMVTRPSTNLAAHGWELNSRHVDHKSEALTTTPQRQVVAIIVVVAAAVQSSNSVHFWLILFFSDRISIPEQVQFSGNIVGESAMHSEVDVGSQVIHRYQVVSR